MKGDSLFDNAGTQGNGPSGDTGVLDGQGEFQWEPEEVHGHAGC